jgi:5-methylcytosine-specific restriction endonuclease McrA
LTGGKYSTFVIFWRRIKMSSLILTLDSHGSPHRWVTLEQAICYHVKDLVAWQTGEEQFIMHGGTSRMTGERSSASSQSIIALRNFSKNEKRKRRVPVLTNIALFRRDRHLCGYCGNKFSESVLTRDHIVPKRAGGQDTWMNTICACKKCNNRKGDILLGSPRANGMKLLFVPYEPSFEENLLLMNRRVLADQMDFLMNFLPEHSRARQEYILLQ